MMKPLFDWFQILAFSVAFRQSTWMFAVIEAAHLLAIAVFVDAVLIVDLRLLGTGLKERPLPQLVVRGHLGSADWLMS